MRVLVVKLGAMGDVVMALSMISAARTLSSDVELTWVVGDRAKPLLELVGGIERIIVVDEDRLLRGGMAARSGEVLKLWGSIAARSYDLVITAHSDVRYRVLTMPVRAGVKRSFSRHGRSGPIAGRYHGSEYCRLVLGEDGPISSGFELPDISQPLPRAPFDPDVGAPIVVLAPGGARNSMRDDPLRRWPLEMYAEVARREASLSRVVVLVGGKGDAEVRDYFKDVPVVDLVGRTSTPQLVATLRAAKVVVTHDSLALHLARLARTPVVALFGPTSPLEKVPHGAIRGGHATGGPVTVLWGGTDLACRPCYDGVNYACCRENRCMRSISPEDVSRSIEAVLASSKTRP